VLSEMLAPIRNEGVEVVFASRLVPGGGVVGEWPQKRRFNSYVAGCLARPLTRVKDAMSGCFFLKKQVIEHTHLVPRGYKIGLEILVKGRYNTVREIPFLFDNRQRGRSKLDWPTRLAYLVQLAHLYMYRLGQALYLQKKTGYRETPQSEGIKTRE
ncbi:MAG: hypothetical protein J7M12_02265, partial [Candidatus Hydrogenedentes bacterium]|nr:hypothetical protein [Candidatus Hydrogenedentota bacterium]